MSTLGIRLGAFTLAMIALAGVLIYPAGLWGGDLGRISLVAAWFLAVIPGWIILTAQMLITSPQQGVYLALGSTVGRLLFVGLGALLVLTLRLLPEQQFAVWTVACYLAALLVETGLVLQQSLGTVVSLAVSPSPAVDAGGR